MEKDRGMGELEFLQRQLNALDELGLIEKKKAEISNLVNNRDVRTLKGEERKQYQQLQKELKELQRKRDEIAGLIAEHKNLSGEQAVTEMKDKMKEDYKKMLEFQLDLEE